jgi:hypothetical protein
MKSGTSANELQEKFPQLRKRWLSGLVNRDFPQYPAYRSKIFVAISFLQLFLAHIIYRAITR